MIFSVSFCGVLFFPVGRNTYKLFPFFPRLQRKRNLVLRLIFRSDKFHWISNWVASTSLSHHSMIDANEIEETKQTKLIKMKLIYLLTLNHLWFISFVWIGFINKCFQFTTKHVFENAKILKSISIIWTQLTHQKMTCFLFKFQSSKILTGIPITKHSDKHDFHRVLHYLRINIKLNFVILYLIKLMATIMCTNLQFKSNYAIKY